MSAVCNSGPLLHLGRLGLLRLLAQLHDPLLIPAAVYDEVVTEGTLRGYSDAADVQRAIDEYAMRVVMIAEDELPAGLRKSPLGVGERHTMGLALREKMNLVLLDDLAARDQAAELGLSVRGTLGTLAIACRNSLLDERETDAAFQTLLDRTDIWLSKTLVHRLWQELRSERAGSP